MKIEVTHVRFEGDNESIRQVLRSLPQLFGGRTGETPMIEQPPAVQALPEPIAAAVIQQPAVARRLSQRNKPTPAPTAAPAAQPPRAKGIGRTSKLVLICREKQGQFNIHQAAALAKVKPGSIHAALGYAKTKGNEWACAGEYQFKRAAVSEPSAKHPDLDGTSVPINPDRISSGEKPTPAEIAAD